MAEKIERVAMQKNELEAMTATGPLAGRSPRAVKRLVNVYRFVRGLHRGKSLDLFLKGGDADNELPRFHGVLFWLALDSGMPGAQVQRMRAGVSQMSEQHCTVSDLTAFGTVPASNVHGAVPADARERLQAFWKEVPAESRDECVAAFDALEKALPGTAGFAVLKNTLEETMRFSFAGLRSVQDS